VEGVSRPVIGICTALERARWSHWDEEAVLLPRSYVQAAQAAGGLAVLIPPDEAFVADSTEILEPVDALVLAGGADIDPSAYGAAPHRETVRTVPERDAAEIALAHGALEADLPLLGICRGMQLLNVALGGTLLQHLPESLGHHDHRRTLGSFDEGDHDVRLEPGSLAARAVGEVLHATKSHHHQGIDRLGEGAVVTGWSTLDGLPEAIEIPHLRFALGVQWHPEVDERSRLMSALVEEAHARRLARAPG
jgi:putative glutamine amidotransferase